MCTSIFSSNKMVQSPIVFTFLAFLCGGGGSQTKNNEVWRSTGMVKSACDQEDEYQKTGQYPKPIKDQKEQGFCGWYSKGQPRGDACADIRMHFTSCKDQNTARQASTRVINGTNARRAFPSVSHHSVCTGSIVNNEWLLTAAHCVDGAGGALRKRLVGNYDLTKKEPNGIILTVEKNVPYPTEDNIVHDIALTKVNHFDFNEHIQPIRMPPSRDFRYMGPAYFVGRGYNDTDGTKPAFLQEVTLPVIDYDICKELYHLEANKPETHYVCAGYFNQGKRACNGDSGGPLFYCHNYQLVQYAVVVAGSYNCGETPNLFMRVSAYLDWILNVTKIQ